MKPQKKGNKEEKSIIENVLGNTPLLGDLVKELAKTDTFKKRFKEVDEEIKEKLKNGEKNKWNFEANISVRPLVREAKQETSEIAIMGDHIYGKKGNKLTLAVKVPTENVKLELKGNNLIITAKDFKKEIELPDSFKEIKKKQCRDGVLMLELAK